MTTANDHQYTYSTDCAVTVRAAPSTAAAKLGSIAIMQPVYSDEAPVKGADGMLWVHATVGWIRADLLTLETHKAPVEQQPGTDKAAALALISSIQRELEQLRGMIA